MAKKIQNTSKKKVKSDTSKGDSILEEINAKLKSSQKNLQKQVDELTSQVKTLSKDPGKTARKLFKTIEKSYHKKVAQLQNDFDKRMDSVLKMQDKVIAQLPKELAEKLHLKTSSTAKPAKKPSKSTKSPAVKVNKSPTTKPKFLPKVVKTVKPAKPKASPKVAKAVKPAKPKSSPKTATIASINGIGPVMQKKLAEAGFTSLEDLANTPESKTEALKQFARTRGFNTWKENAQALLKSK